MTFIQVAFAYIITTITALLIDSQIDAIVFQHYYFAVTILSLIFGYFSASVKDTRAWKLFVLGFSYIILAIVMSKSMGNTSAFVELSKLSVLFYFSFLLVTGGSLRCMLVKKPLIELHDFFGINYLSKNLDEQKLKLLGQVLTIISTVISIGGTILTWL